MEPLRAVFGEDDEVESRVAPLRSLDVLGDLPTVREDLFLRFDDGDLVVDDRHPDGVGR